MTASADRIDRLTTAIGRAVAWLALGHRAAAIRAGGRALSCSASARSGSTETVIYAHATLFMLAAAWTLRAGGHVRVDVFYAEACAAHAGHDRSRRRAAAAVAVHAVLIWLRVPYAARSWAILERSQETSGLPLVFLLKTLIPLFALLMALARRRAGDPRAHTLVEAALMPLRRNSRRADGRRGHRRADGRLSGGADARRRVARLRRARPRPRRHGIWPSSARCRSASSA